MQGENPARHMHLQDFDDDLLDPSKPIEDAAARLRIRTDAPLDSLQAIVLDEADALVAPLSRYATFREKQVSGIFVSNWGASPARCCSRA